MPNERVKVNSIDPYSMTDVEGKKKNEEKKALMHMGVALTKRDQCQ